MKVHLFNHWFKYKVPVDNHFEQITGAKFNDNSNVRYSNIWRWLNDRYDVGQYYNWKEGRNYLTFHNEQHYLMFLLKL